MSPLRQATHPAPPFLSSSTPRWWELHPWGVHLGPGTRVGTLTRKGSLSPFPSQFSWGIPLNRWQLRLWPGSGTELINWELPQWKFTGCVRRARASPAPAAASLSAPSRGPQPGDAEQHLYRAASPCPSSPTKAERTARVPEEPRGSHNPGRTWEKCHFALYRARAALKLGWRRRGKAEMTPRRPACPGQLLRDA